MYGWRSVSVVPRGFDGGQLSVSAEYGGIRRDGLRIRCGGSVKLFNIVSACRRAGCFVGAEHRRCSEWRTLLHSVSGVSAALCGVGMMRKILSALFLFASILVASPQIGPPPGGGGGGTPGGTNGQIQFNNSGTFGGRSPLLASDLPKVNHPGYVAGNWYLPIGSIAAYNSGGPSLLTAYCSIIQIGGNSSATISALAMKTSANGGNISLAIYNNDLSSGQARPGTLADSTPPIVASTAGNLFGNLNSPPP